MSENILSISSALETSVTLAAAYLAGHETDETPDRMDLLNRMNAGEHVELDIEAVTYLVGPEIQNRNLHDLSIPALRQFAKSAVNTPFSRDHSMSTEDIGGFVLKSKVQKSDRGHELHESIRLNKQWAVEAALNGNLKKFSIHWNYGPFSNVHCSYCKDSMLACDHWPGEELEKRGKPHVVSLISQQGEAVERSWVFRPAVPATEMKTEFLSALSEHRSKRPESGEPNHGHAKIKTMNSSETENDMITEFASMLGCEESDVMDVLKGKLALADDLASQLSDALAENKTLSEELNTQRTAAMSAECDKLISQLHTDGMKEGGSMEDVIRAAVMAGNSELVASLSAAVKEAAVVKSEPMQSRSALGDPIIVTPELNADKLKDQLFAMYPAHKLMHENHSHDARLFFEKNPTLLALVVPGVDYKDLK